MAEVKTQGAVEAMEVAEASRQTEWEKPSYVGDLFLGKPQPLYLVGTEEQKQKYLPRLAKGAISAFALTEPGVGSDPAKMQTTARPTPDGKGWVINGEKLWCTNGTKAELIVVMAQTP